MNFQVTDGGSPLRESNGGAAELARAVRISLCGLDLGRTASFVPQSLATADFDWQQWLRTEFSGGLGKAYISVFQHAGQMQVRELIEVDRSLGGDACRDAGAALLERLEEAKDLRVVDRMRAVLADGERPHFATAFAVECAEFHLPLRAALISYLYGEWRCGMSALGEKGDLDAFAAAGGQLVFKVVGDALTQGDSPFENAAGL